MTKKLPRPPYWCPDFVIEELKDGRTLIDIARQAAEDVGLGGERFSADFWYTDVHNWKKEVEGFRRRYKEARGWTEEEASKGGRPETFGPEAQTEFLQEMARNGGDPTKACYDLGVARNTVFSRINPKSPRYDEQFALRFADAEAERHGEIYEKYLNTALAVDEDGEAKHTNLIWRVAEQRIPHLFSQKRHLEIEGSIRHDHQLPAAVTRQLATTQRALEDPDVVEAEVLS